jgi:hypothetical protein
MLAKITTELAALEKDFQHSGVLIRYFDNGELKSVEVGGAHSSHQPHVEFVVRAFLEVTPCDCPMCEGESEPTTLVIPEGKIVDVAVEEIDQELYAQEINPFLPVARWLRNKFGELKRFALD